jgi:hypothetical protein
MKDVDEVAVPQTKRKIHLTQFLKIIKYTVWYLKGIIGFGKSQWKFWYESSKKINILCYQILAYL